MRRAKLICIIGMDGSGKTTTSRIVAEAADARNYSVQEVYGGYNAWILKPFLRVATPLLTRRTQTTLAPKREQYKKYRKSLTRTLSLSRFLTGVFVRLILLDYTLQIFYKITLPLWRGQCILSDRWVFDTTVNIADNLNLSHQQHLDLMRKWLKYFPQPNLIVWVVTPASICLERKDDIPSPEYVLNRIPYYESMAQHISVKKLDGASPIREVKLWAEEMIERMLS